MKCAACGYQNLPDAMNCVQCGKPLVKPPPPPGMTGYAPTDVGNEIMLYILDEHVSRLKIKLEKKLLVGRNDKEASESPDIDLSPYDAAVNGVSRFHAQIGRKDGAVVIEDLNSLNGTFVNGQRLLPHQPRVVQNGDEICLAYLRTYIYIQPPL